MLKIVKKMNLERLSFQSGKFVMGQIKSIEASKSSQCSSWHTVEQVVGQAQSLQGPRKRRKSVIIDTSQLAR